MIDHILCLVAEKFDVSVDDIKSQRRNSYVLPARHIAAYLAQSLSGLSSADIGILFGGRDYTTIRMYCRAVSRRATEDAAFQRCVQELEGRIRGHADLS